MLHCLFFFFHKIKYFANNHILKLQRVAWSLAANSTSNLVSSNYENLHDTLNSNRLNQINESLTNLENIDDVNVCREALECLSLSLCLVPHALESLNQEKHWRTFIVDFVLFCGSKAIRQTASEQFLLKLVLNKRSLQEAAIACFKGSEQNRWRHRYEFFVGI